MKSGTSDPFADDEPTDTDESDESESEPSQSEQTAQSGESDQPSSNTEQFDRSDLPYILRRSKVKDERGNVHQLFVRDQTEERARDAERELQDQFGDVYRLDAREAIYLAGMQNLDDAEDILREWGIDL